MKQKDELEDYFNDYVKDISELNASIEATDNEINKLVYKRQLFKWRSRALARHMAQDVPMQASDRRSTSRREVFNNEQLVMRNEYFKKEKHIIIFSIPNYSLLISNYLKILQSAFG